VQVVLSPLIQTLLSCIKSRIATRDHGSDSVVLFLCVKVLYGDEAKVIDHYERVFGFARPALILSVSIPAVKVIRYARSQPL
jgi:hypothetical protein